MGAEIWLRPAPLSLFERKESVHPSLFLFFLLFIFLFLPKSSYSLPKHSEKDPNSNIVRGKGGYAKSFRNGSSAFPFEIPSATVCVMLKTTSVCWNPKDPLALE